MKAPALVVATLVIIGTTSAMAAEPSKFKIFGGLSYVSPLGEKDVDLGSVRDSVEASDEVGWNVGFEARFNKWLGLEMDYVNADNDIEFGGEKIDSIHIQPVSATLTFHLIPTKVVDFYFGPTVSYFIWDDPDLGTGTKFETDNEFAYGAAVGLDVGLGGHLAITGGVRWLDVDLEPENVDKIEIDPLISRLGVAWRF